MRSVLLLSPLYRWGNWGGDRGHSLPRVTQLVSGGIKWWSQAGWLQAPRTAHDCFPPPGPFISLWHEVYKSTNLISVVQVGNYRIFRLEGTLSSNLTQFPTHCKLPSGTFQIDEHSFNSAWVLPVTGKKYCNMYVKYKLFMDKLLHNKNMPNGYTSLICSSANYVFICKLILVKLFL